MKWALLAVAISSAMLLACDAHSSSGTSNSSDAHSSSGTSNSSDAYNSSGEYNSSDAYSSSGEYNSSDAYSSSGEYNSSDAYILDTHNSSDVRNSSGLDDIIPEFEIRTRNIFQFAKELPVRMLKIAGCKEGYRWAGNRCRKCYGSCS